MAEHGGNSSDGDVIDRPEDMGGPMEVEVGDQWPMETVADAGVVAKGGGDGSRDQQQEVGGGDECRATKAEPHAIEEARAVEPSVEPVGSGIVAEGSPVVGGSSAGVGGSGAIGDDIGPIEPITKYDIAEHLPDEALAKLLEDNLIIGKIVLRAKEERARAIAASEAAKRAKRE
ncbi:hypothetical protein RHMOL_Rhmol08G0178500 [Rhododendron molle]|uniref:Uncharacterized protein n=1 Tax=Rhododendron molle TaxID=49168 RepID=A0ACC0MPS0_RHOML|nr:hypothetical protein RHMOL_Rhmol08G0178500 [Rhododendron molle]